jgi:hypothetical protein
MDDVVEIESSRSKVLQSNNGGDLNQMSLLIFVGKKEFIGNAWLLIHLNRMGWLKEGTG